jgi:chemotaxis protein MotB
MSGLPNQKRPIVVKRHGPPEEEHGGQWKVAYADFVTAMMAFFLIMWLLSSTTQSERTAIAKYFATTSIFQLMSGNGVMDGGRSVMDGAEARAERLTPRSQDGAAQARHDDVSDKAGKVVEITSDRIERQRLEALKAELERMMRQGGLHDFADNLAIEMTPEGLRIQIFDRDDVPMFATGGAAPTPRLVAILQVIAQVLGTVQNAVVVTGHTDSQILQRSGYSNWELSADRANASRRQLVEDGLPATRFLSVEGRADTDPLLPESPSAARNRRIAVTVLRNAVEAFLREVHHSEPGSPPP